MKKTKLFKIGEESFYPNMRAKYDSESKTPYAVECFEYIDRYGTIDMEEPKYSFSCNTMFHAMAELMNITTPFYTHEIEKWFLSCKQ